jgi:hypothetical protein
MGRGRQDLGAATIPFAVRYALEVATARLAAGDPEGALAALWLGTRGSVEVPRAARSLLVRCVAVRRPLWRLALRVALSGGSLPQRGAAAAAVLCAAAGLWQTRMRSYRSAVSAGGLASSGCNREAFWQSDP